jgi:hypothetical protein
MDARRMENDYPAVTKRVKMPEGDMELATTVALVGWHTASDPRNQSVLVYVISRHSDDHNKWNLVVMPLLRPFHDPDFDTTGEAVGFFKQIFEVCKLGFDV